MCFLQQLVCFFIPMTQGPGIEWHLGRAESMISRETAIDPIEYVHTFLFKICWQKASKSRALEQLANWGETKQITCDICWLNHAAVSPLFASRAATVFLAKKIRWLLEVNLHETTDVRLNVSAPRRAGQAGPGSINVFFSISIMTSHEDILRGIPLSYMVYRLRQVHVEKPQQPMLSPHPQGSHE